MPELRRVVLLSALILATSFVSGCSAGAPPTAEPTPVDARCKRVDPLLVGQLMNAITQGYSVRDMWYVRSADYSDTLFMSGDLQGPGLEGNQDIATWAIDMSIGSGTWYEVSPLAGQYGGWIPGSYVHYSMTDDGAQLSADCARSAAASEAQPS